MRPVLRLSPPPPLPRPWQLPSFQSGGSRDSQAWLRLLLVRTLRRDCTLACVRWFVRSSEWLGER